MSGTPLKSYKACVLTVSDTRSTGENPDTVGPKLVEMLRDAGYKVSEPFIVPDDKDIIASTLINLADNDKFDFIVTTGGTGLSERDRTPDATREIIDFEVPGLGECMRFEGYKQTMFSWLSRGTAGVRGRSLILNVPGSERGAVQSLQAILPIARHALEIIKGDTHECGKKEGEND